MGESNTGEAPKFEPALLIKDGDPFNRKPGLLGEPSPGALAAALGKVRRPEAETGDPTVKSPSVEKSMAPGLPEGLEDNAPFDAQPVDTNEEALDLASEQE